MEKDSTMPQDDQAQAPHDPAAARIRNLVIDRLLRMNARHANHAWLRRRTQPVGPHGLAFLYGDQPSPNHYHEVAAATRLVDDGTDVRDLPRLLYRLANLARDRHVSTAGGFDPRTTLTNRHDPMSSHAVYLGIGVSSLDTSMGTWEQAQHTASGPLDLPGRCFALLSDGTMLLVERGAQDAYGEVRIRSTHDLNLSPGISPRKWTLKPDLAATAGTREIWRRIYDLHELVLRYG